MNNNQKSLSFQTKFSASVALRTVISKQWQCRQNCRKIGMANSVGFWTNELRTNIAAYREINTL